MIELVNDGRCAVSAIHDENPTTDRLSGDATVAVKDIARSTIPREHVNIILPHGSVSIANFDLRESLFR